jgi:NAD(P)-dependent dehydrogenase (short-subunit alcohol dehydrogenase family)
VDVVLITGCSSGFGLETALAFARHGDAVCATMRSLAKGDVLRRQAAEEGLDVDVVSLDVTDDESVVSAIGEIRDRHGPIDVLVNNAGVDYDGAVETISMDAARTLMETNFWGALRMIRAALPDMRRRRSGVIVNVSSAAGRIPGYPYAGLYSASKHALGALSESLATELMPFDLRVVCIEPGNFETEIGTNSRAGDNGIAASVYEPDYAWFRTFMTSQPGADPKVVADAIVAAVEDPVSPLHRAVGDDADILIPLWEQARTFEQWSQIATPIVEEVAGPRPSAP